MEKKSLAEKIAAIQGKIKKVIKRGKNPHFGSDYALDDDIMEMLLPITSAEGVAVIGGPVMVEGDWVWCLEVTDGSETIPRQMPYPTDLPIQKDGSRQTYCHRYLVKNFFGIPAGGDDDGNAASPPPPITSAQIRCLMDRGKEIGLTPPQINAGACKGTKASKIDELTHEEAANAIERLGELYDQKKLISDMKGKANEIASAKRETKEAME